MAIPAYRVRHVDGVLPLCYQQALYAKNSPDYPRPFIGSVMEFPLTTLGPYDKGMWGSCKWGMGTVVDAKRNGGAALRPVHTHYWKHRWWPIMLNEGCRLQSAPTPLPSRVRRVVVVVVGPTVDRFVASGWQGARATLVACIRPAPQLSSFFIVFWKLGQLVGPIPAGALRRPRICAVRHPTRCATHRNYQHALTSQGRCLCCRHGVRSFHTFECHFGALRLENAQATCC